jgi:hypothetical protein
MHSDAGIQCHAEFGLLHGKIGLTKGERGEGNSVMGGSQIGRGEGPSPRDGQGFSAATASKQLPD